MGFRVFPVSLQKNVAKRLPEAVGLVRERRMIHNMSCDSCPFHLQACFFCGSHACYTKRTKALSIDIISL